MPEQLSINGKTRTAQNLDTVDNIEGGPAHPSALATAPVTAQPKPHPSSYAPSDDAPAPGPRVYGSPIEGNAASK